MKTKNVVQRPDFSQVCVWPAVLVGSDSIEEFETFMQTEFDARIQYLEEIKTAPDTLNGFPIEDTGGRNDVLFAIHTEDVPKFAIKRLPYGIRWIEDVYGNGGGDLYPARIANYKTW